MCSRKTGTHAKYETGRCAVYAVRETGSMPGVKKGRSRKENGDKITESAREQILQAFVSPCETHSKSEV